MHEDTVIQILRENGIDCVATLPCDKARDLFFRLPEAFPHIGLTREEDGVGVCAGAYLAGKRPAMVIQSSGLGNMLNALLSLDRTYGIPLPILASWRGCEGEKIPAQVPFNRALPGILQAAEIPYHVIRSPGDLDEIGTVIRMAFAEKTPAVALIVPPCLEGSGPAGSPPLPMQAPSRSAREVCYAREGGEPVLTRYDAIRTIAPLLKDEAVVSNIGVPSKELFAARDRDLNFYMLGSYTQASPLGLGIACADPGREIIVLDGDGSLLGTGILPVIASLAPPNLTIVCLDNGTFGSTGNQPDAAAVTADLGLLAKAAGFPVTCTTRTAEELRTAVAEKKPGPGFIHALIRPGNADVPDIPLSPAGIRDRFMQALKKR